MRTTSKGWVMMYSPLRENMTIIVKKSAMRVIGLILGAKTVSNQALPFVLSKENRVMTPARKGIPR